jgi:U4/U6.U5 tri-snRNP-associated protein 2
MAWLLNKLHSGLGGTRKPRLVIIYKCFQGNIKVPTCQRKTTKEMEEGDKKGKDGIGKEIEESPQIEEITVDMRFLQLTLDIPEKPLFWDDDGGLVIPQEPLVTVLKKSDGIFKIC